MRVPSGTPIRVRPTRLSRALMLPLPKPVRIRVDGQVPGLSISAWGVPALILFSSRVMAPFVLVGEMRRSPTLKVGVTFLRTLWLVVDRP